MTNNNSDAYTYIGVGVRGGVVVTITAGPNKTKVLADTLEFAERHPFGEYTALGLLTVYRGGSAGNLQTLIRTPAQVASLKETDDCGMTL